MFSFFTFVFCVDAMTRVVGMGETRIFSLAFLCFLFLFLFSLYVDLLLVWML